ncbi:hypothetical protein BDV36DRAFT_112182 [Aspergillus pseudocaelatus]|uniref:Uncharacterized protein n=1 Tax=Aspergillus pseudocaelatus TaxID=1825620 RepID=A0ABQ6W0R7_9EURO|nr:hypothetical protein BDV36DRAFT_112182 [Aspergillus pseudocaelatus]
MAKRTFFFNQVIIINISNWKAPSGHTFFLSLALFLSLFLFESRSLSWKAIPYFLSSVPSDFNPFNNYKHSHCHFSMCLSAPTLSHSDIVRFVGRAASTRFVYLNTNDDSTGVYSRTTALAGSRVVSSTRLPESSVDKVNWLGVLGPS